MKYDVFSIEIEDGSIFHDFFAETQNKKDFISQFHIVEVFHVKGWHFTTIHLTHGTQEHGCGWAFVRTKNERIP